MTRKDFLKASTAFAAAVGLDPASFAGSTVGAAFKAEDYAAFRRELRRAATVRDSRSGRKMEVWTTEPGLQVYGSQAMNGSLPGKAEGVRYPKYAGLALETQHFPDSPNHPEFPSTVLRPGETFHSVTEFRFGF